MIKRANKMNNKILVVIGILLLAIVVVGIYKLQQNTPAKSMTIKKLPAVSKYITVTKPQIMQGSLKSLLSNGKPVKCTFTTSTASAAINGSVYVANGKVKGDFKSDSSEATVNSHILLDSTDSYVWTDMSNQGIKFPITIQNGISVTPNPNYKTSDINQNYDYICQDWSPDLSVFTVPKNIVFQEMTIPTMAPTALNPSAGASTAGSTSLCSSCNSVPQGYARDSCRKQLHCQ